MMLDKLDGIEEKYEELTQQLSDHELLTDQSRYARVAKQHRDLKEIVEKYREFKSLDRGLRETKELLEGETDDEMVNLARAELSELEQRLAKVEEDFTLLLSPKDPNDEKNGILEIPAGTGGDGANPISPRTLGKSLRYP